MPIGELLLFTIVYSGTSEFEVLPQKICKDPSSIFGIFYRLFETISGEESGSVNPVFFYNSSCILMSYIGYLTYLVSKRSPESNVWIFQ